ncbi:MAG: glycosyltransferase family 4 protein [Bdellovibrionales bacterium]
MKNIGFIINEVNSFYNHRLGIIAAFVNPETNRLKVLLPVNEKQSKEIELDQKHLEVEKWGLSRRGINPIAELKSIFGVSKFLKQDHSTVFLFTIKPVIYGLLLKPFFNKTKFIAVITGIGSVFLGKSLRNRFLELVVRSLYKFVFKNADRVVFQNLADRDFFIGSGYISEDKCVLIEGSGVDTDVFKPVGKNKIGTPVKLLFPSRVIKDKGIVELVDAIKESGLSRDDVQLILAGDIDEENPSRISKSEFEKMIGGDLRFKWIGYSRSLVKVYQESDLVVLPSYREGLSKSLLEAASCGLPIVTTDVPGCREVVEDGVNGYLCEPRCKESLRKCILRALNDKNNWDELGRKGRQRVIDRFSLSSVQKSFLETMDF